MSESRSSARLHQGRIGRVFPVLLALGFGLPAPSLAVDGVIEINQAKALAGSVTTGDFVNFPVSLTQPGSYRLTSDLSVPSAFDGIQITADNVSLDLNGFNVIGGGGSAADGISLVGQKNIEIKNGTIRGFSRHGVFANAVAQLIWVIGVRSVGNGFSGFELEGVGHLVDGCTAASNGTLGIFVGDGSLVINSVSRGNVNLGLVLSATAGYRSNVLTGNNGGDANAQATGIGLQLGSNVCGSDLVCP